MQIGGVDIFHHPTLKGVKLASSQAQEQSPLLSPDDETAHFHPKATDRGNVEVEEKNADDDEDNPEVDEDNLPHSISAASLVGCGLAARCVMRDTCR
ncbi:hypothetical protein CHU98_g10872 [Xylaria longipes]|nr:hypothetical protein CHU98_g10872 [Xylaria longipes]